MVFSAIQVHVNAQICNLRIIDDNALDYFFTSECINYKSLTDSTRKLDNPLTNPNHNWKTDHLNDSSIPWTTQISKSGISDDWQGEAWYRVMGGAGTRIPENPFTMAQFGNDKYCRTNCPGYLPSGSHPQTPGELVTDVKVCYNCNAEYFNGNMCNYSKNYVKIRHCGNYFVYFLTQNTVTWAARYCTE